MTSAEYFAMNLTHRKISFDKNQEPRQLFSDYKFRKVDEMAFDLCQKMINESDNFQNFKNERIKCEAENDLIFSVKYAKLNLGKITVKIIENRQNLTCFSLDFTPSEDFKEYF